MRRKGYWSNQLVSLNKVFIEGGATLRASLLLLLGNLLWAQDRMAMLITHQGHDTSNQHSDEPSVCVYLQEVADSYLDPYAARFFQVKTSLGIQNEKKRVL
jgi:hypothetical protein